MCRQMSHTAALLFFPIFNESRKMNQTIYVIFVVLRRKANFTIKYFLVEREKSSPLDSFDNSFRTTNVSK